MGCALLQARDPVRHQVFIVAESRLPHIPGAVPKAKKGGGKAKEGAAPKEGEGGWEVLSKMTGADLVGVWGEGGGVAGWGCCHAAVGCGTHGF